MVDNIKVEYTKTPFGELILGSYNDRLCLCDWRYRKMRFSIDNRLKSGLVTDFIEESSNIVEETKVQLTQYFNGERTEFDIPLLLIGSYFQKRVWNALLQIPYGSTDTYLGLSKKLENQKAIRAVAAANGANAISIIVPCHRIIGSDGSMVGYAAGLDTKMKLLKLENALNQSQLSLF
ncbi:MAG: methylated-DNA--[protein]-cysteine S-methyltransferase [Bacteroidetes bacterium]|nr:methylated-DNA--[protein]-cysteine S-methyltransferase [Bacteroidota bacterium]MBL6942866.1 methylated-DNA--[protein]-cysteine S-methyltransferase [Bacteroidales bacterium]